MVNLGNKVLLQSIKELPKKWIHSKTSVAVFNNNPIAINENYEPMIYLGGAWENLSPYLPKN